MSEKSDKNFNKSFFFARKTGSSKTAKKSKNQNTKKRDKKNLKPELKVLNQYPRASEPFKVEVLAEDLGIVWGMVFINSKEILFTEREGSIKILNIQTGALSSVSGAPKVYARGQGGLLDISLHPRFSKNKKIYLSYSKKKGGKQTTAIARGILKRKNVYANGKKKKKKVSEEISITSLKDIFLAQPFISASRHFGSRLLFDKKGFLYVTIGDRTERDLAQELNNHFGKILRLDDRGRAPKGNPFTSVKNALPEIWSYGHRNAQGLFLHPVTGQLWEQEHGPRGGDEINLIKKGKNYGWPVITYGREYWGPSIGEGSEKKGMEQPVKYYVPSIAPSGLLIYSGKKFKKWKNSFFSGALVLRHLNRLEIVKNKARKEERLLSDLDFRVRHVIEGPKGYIYVSVDAGKILRLKPIPQKRAKL